jgi:hypothetical protein
VLALEGHKRPERWIMVEVEEAYIQCSKHIPLVQKKDRTIDWGTDSVAAKKGDYFQILDIPLYDRIGGDDAMEIVVDVFYRKVLGSRQPILRGCRYGGATAQAESLSRYGLRRPLSLHEA